MWNKPHNDRNGFIPQSSSAALLLFCARKRYVLFSDPSGKDLKYSERNQETDNRFLIIHWNQDTIARYRNVDMVLLIIQKDE